MTKTINKTPSPFKERVGVRIYSLINFDWMTNRSKLKLTLGLIVIIYACLAPMTYFSKGIYFGEVNPDLPTILAQFISSYFGYAQFAMLIVLTTILHHKFTNPRSATSYLTMPGTSLEKWAVMLMEYIIGAVAVFALYVLCHGITMLIGWILSPELHWWVNPLDDTMDQLNNYMIAMDGQSWDEVMDGVQSIEGMTGDVATKLIDTVNLMIYFNIFIQIAWYLLYICLNMCFRTNGQIKTIAILFGGSFVLGVFAVVSIIASLANIAAVGDVSPTMVASSVSNTLMTIIYIWRFFIFASPLFIAGFSYLFYRQIAKKQAK